MRMMKAALIAVLFGWAVVPAIASFYTADDFLLVAVSVPSSAADAIRYFTTDWGGSATGGTYYRPLVNLSLWINRELTGLSPVALRLTGLTIHVAVSLLVIAIARIRLRFTADTALLSGACFLLFPMHDQAILWIAARPELLCAMFYAAAFLGLTAPSLRSQLLGMAAFAAALASKEMAITLPGAVALWWVVFARPAMPSRLARPLLLMMAAVMAYAACRFMAIRGLGGDPAFFVFDSRLLDGAIQMLLWSLLPFDLERLRDFARIHTALIVPLYAVALIGVYVVVRLLRRDRAALFGLAWITITMLPVIARPNVWYAYIPSIGGCLLIAALCGSFVRTRAALGFAVIVVAAAGLHGGSATTAAAGRLARMLVEAGSKAGTDLFVVNSPIVIAGRYGVVTDQTHFDAGAGILGSRFRTIPLNYAYIEDADDRRLGAAWDGDAIVAAADVGRRTFLTLDGIGVADTRAVLGAHLEGARAAYQVLEIRRGQIASIRIVPRASDLGKERTVAFIAGRLEKLK